MYIMRSNAWFDGRLSSIDVVPYIFINIVAIKRPKQAQIHERKQ